MSSKGIVYKEKPQKCELCKKKAETRPYGPKGEEICIECAKKDVKGTEERMKKYLWGGK